MLFTFSVVPSFLLNRRNRPKHTTSPPFSRVQNFRGIHLSGQYGRAGPGSLHAQSLFTVRWKCRARSENQYREKPWHFTCRGGIDSLRATNARPFRHIRPEIPNVDRTRFGSRSYVRARAHTHTLLRFPSCGINPHSGSFSWIGNYMCATMSRLFTPPSSRVCRCFLTHALAEKKQQPVGSAFKVPFSGAFSAFSAEARSPA